MKSLLIIFLILMPCFAATAQEIDVALRSSNMPPDSTQQEILEKPFAEKEEPVSAPSSTFDEKKNRDSATFDNQITEQSSTFDDDITNQSSTLGEEITTASSTFQKPGRSGLDTIVTYSAKDSVVFDLNAKKMRLRGDAKLDYGKQKLTAEIIEIDFNESLLSAAGAKDTSGRYYGFPNFNDKGEEFAGETIKFNFKTKKGLISLGETEMSEGFYFGSKIKRVSEEVLFVQNGYYTTCDLGDPHYYFGSPEMKVVAKDRVFLDPIIFFVEDLPLFVVPFGLFFPSQGGRQSGLVIPTVFFSGNRGVVFEDLGVYLALSDYYDTKFSTDLYSKGGYMLKNHTRWNWTDHFRGNLTLEYGNTRFNPEDEFTENFALVLNHDQDIDPFTSFDVSLNFRSQNFNKNTSFYQNERIQQTISSRASFSKRFENGSNLSLSFERDQNIINDEYTQNFPNLTYSLPNWYPMKGLVSSGSSMDWLRDVSFSYSFSGRRTDRAEQDITRFDDGARDTSMKKSHSTSLTHNPSLSISPKLGHFNIKPFINFNAKNYFRRVSKKFRAVDSTVVDSFDDGFFTEYNYSLGVSLSTRLFGIARPRLFNFDSLTGISAMRHTYQPTIRYSYSPDLSDPSIGFYGKYYDPLQERDIVYSRYAADGGGLASRSESQSIGYSDLHSFEVKVRQGDTLEDKNLELLKVNSSFNYNFVADSLNFSDINLSFRSNAIQFLNLSGRTQLTAYDDANRLDKDGNIIENSYKKINTFLLENGKGLLRITSFSLDLSTQFSSQGVSLDSRTYGMEEDTSKTEGDSISLGERFRSRVEPGQDEVDLFGDSSPGYTPFSIPWNASLGISYNYNKLFSQSEVDQRINLTINFGVNLTESWRINGNAQYDLLNKELLAPSINISKDMHCWELNINWYPTGFNRGFYLRFGIKASMLKDLQIEKRSSPLY